MNGNQSALASAVQASSALTPDQLNALRAQVSAYKQLARNQPMSSQLQAHLANGSPTDQQSTVSITSKMADAAADSHAAHVAAHGPDPIKSSAEENSSAKKAESDIGPSKPADDPSSKIYPYNAYLHPFTLLAKPALSGGNDLASLQQRLLIPSLLPAGVNSQLLLEERERFIQARIQQRIRELESFPASIAVTTIIDM